MFSEKSDVWSFAMFLYELITYGRHPFHGSLPACRSIQSYERMRKMPELGEEEVRGAVFADRLVEGLRPGWPAGCPEALWQLLLAAWDSFPPARPPFAALLPSLVHIHHRLSQASE